MNKNHFSFYVAALALLLGMLPQRLLADGTLTMEESEAGTFQLEQVPEETTGFSSIYSEEVEKAFYVKSLSSYFTNANKAVGDRIRTAGNVRTTYEAQVFFLNEDGYLRF